MNKSIRSIFFIGTLILGSLQLQAQPDTTIQPKGLYLGVSNDCFQRSLHSDKYFTASFRLGMIHKIFDNALSRKVLIGFNKHINTFGVTIKQDGFTPENLRLSEIDYTDRPYAGLLYLDYWRQSANAEKRFLITSGVKLGISGAYTFVEETQKAIHRSTGDPIPQGWHNQVGTGLMLDSYIRAEKFLFPRSRLIQLTLGGSGEIGSLYNLAAIHSSVYFGRFNKQYMSFNGLSKTRKNGSKLSQCFITLTLSDMFIFYDGTLQGGLVPFEKSPYTYKWNEYRHNSPLAIFELTCTYKGLLFRYRKTKVVNMYFLHELFYFGEIEFVFSF